MARDGLEIYIAGGVLVGAVAATGIFFAAHLSGTTLTAAVYILGATSGGLLGVAAAVCMNRYNLFNPNPAAAPLLPVMAPPVAAPFLGGEQGPAVVAACAA